MSDERIDHIRIVVTTNEGRPYEVDDIITTREDLHLTIARLTAQIEAELDRDGLLDGNPVSVEQENPDSSTVIAAHPRDIQATLTLVGDDTALWLPNDDGFGDGSRIYTDQLADTLAVINRAAAIIHERSKSR